MKIAWLSDIHLNFLRHPRACVALGEYVAKDLDEYEAEEDDGRSAVIVTGDIAECAGLVDLLDDFIRGVGRTVYFVLGNHDFYGGSLEAGYVAARAITKHTKGIWLTEAGVRSLTSDAALVGVDGWYDARNGSPYTSNVEMSDFHNIRDLTDGLFRRLSNQELRNRCQIIADGYALKAKALLEEAAPKYKQVYFATHVPPFVGATWHEGKTSDSNWLPWMSSKAMGDMLLEVGQAHPDTEFTVLCGHTHSPGEYIALPNMTVSTAKAVYGHPAVHKIIEL